MKIDRSPSQEPREPFAVNAPAEGAACPAHLLLLDRCRVLDLPTWRFDTDLNLLAEPSETGHAGRWCRSDTIRNAVVQQARAWMADESPAIARLAEGFSLIPILETVRRRRVGLIVVAALGQELVGSALLAASAAPDLDETRRAVAPIAIYPAAVIPRLATCLGWSQSDLNSSVSYEATLAGFSLKLAESYEEITLLQKLGRSMNQVAHPRKFVALACEELQRNLAYEWIAVQFVSDRRLARGMSGRLTHAGRTPVPHPRFDSEIERLLASLPPESNEARILQGREAPRLAIPLHPAHPAAHDPRQLLIQPVVREGIVVAAIIAGDKQGEDKEVSSTDIKLLETAAAFLTILLDNAILYDEQQLMFVGTLEALTSSIDAKDPYTRGHSERVAGLSAALAEAHGLSEEQVERVRLAGIVHDVGKIGVPEAVLCKTGRLTDEEFDLIRQHPEIGFQILRDIPQFEDLLPGVLSHHERFDGSGYPHKLRGHDIPLMARIIGLVDAFDAMSSNRTYRAAMPRDRVYEELAENAGSQFDPDLVESFRRVDLARYDELVERHQAEFAADQPGTNTPGGFLFRRSASAGGRGGLAA